MRIVRVVLVFFAIGFAASSVEEAFGLGDPMGVPPGYDRLEESVTAVRGGHSAGVAIASIGHGVPRERRAPSVNPLGQAPDDAAPVLYATEETSEWPAVVPAYPGRPGLALAMKRRLSEPETLPASRIPAGKWMSTSGDPLAEDPTPELGASEGAPQEFVMPFESGRVTSLFHQGRYHPAIDLAGPLGTPVHATTGRQRVVFAGWRGGYGNAVMAQDDLGRVHLYGHLRSITARVGSVLEQGQRLGTLGSTGHSTGPHVHYEVRTRGGGHINPVTLLFPGRKVGKGYAWTGARSMAKVAARAEDQPRPR